MNSTQQKYILVLMTDCIMHQFLTDFKTIQSLIRTHNESHIIVSTQSNHILLPLFKLFHNLSSSSKFLKTDHSAD